MAPESLGFERATVFAADCDDLVKPDALVLELGSYIGKSTRYIAGLLNEGGHLLTCDAWDNDLLEGALGHNYLRSDDEKRSFELYETFLVESRRPTARARPFATLAVLRNKRQPRR